MKTWTEKLMDAALGKAVGRLFRKDLPKKKFLAHTAGLLTSLSIISNRVTKDGDFAKESQSFCDIGCYQCCYRMPYVRTHFEERYLRWKLNQLLKGSPKKQKELSQRASTAYSAWQDLCLANGMKSETQAYPLALEPDWCATNTPCILLDLSTPSRTCMVYPHAPTDCRITTRPKDSFNGQCPGPLNPPPVNLGVPGSISHLATSMCQKIDKKTGYGNYVTKPLIEVLRRWVIR